MSASKCIRGYTLIELLVALSLFLLAQAWVVPALAELVQSHRVHNSAQSLSDSLMRARNEAVARNSRVVVCKSRAGQACEVSGGWEQGWIIFHDANNNAAFDPGEALVYREHALPASLRLSGNMPVRDYVSYTPYGQAKLTSGAFQAGTFTVCTIQDKRNLARQVIINSGGRSRVAKAMVDLCA